MHFSFQNKAFFYISLLFYKATSFLECKNHRYTMLVNECKFILTRIGIRTLQSKNKDCITVQTNRGKMYIRNIDIDLTIASPSFERLDIDYCIKLMNQSLQNNHKIVYVDIGAGFGNQIIICSHFFSKMGITPRILAFEPDTESYKLLQKNIAVNKIKNIHPYKVALSNKKATQTFYFLDSMKQIVSFPTNKTVSITTDTLNNYIKPMNLDKDTDLYIKIDIEGHEIEALEGAKKLKGKCKAIFLMIEDSVEARKIELEAYLRTNATFLDKRTTYNSFWKLHW